MKHLLLLTTCLLLSICACTSQKSCGEDHEPVTVRLRSADGSIHKAMYDSISFRGVGSKKLIWKREDNPGYSLFLDPSRKECAFEMKKADKVDTIWFSYTPQIQKNESKCKDKGSYGIYYHDIQITRTTLKPSYATITILPSEANNTHSHDVVVDITFMGQ